LGRSIANRRARRAERARRRRAGAAMATGAAGLLLPASAWSTTWDESVDGDLPGSFATRALMDPGVDFLTGGLTDVDEDHFTFYGIAPGTLYSVRFESAGDIGYVARFHDELGIVVDSAQVFVGNGHSFEGVFSIPISLSVCCGPEAWSATLDLVSPQASYDESLDGELGVSYAGRTRLGAGLERITGRLDPGTDLDFFTLTGLPGDHNFVLLLDLPDTNGIEYVGLDESGGTVKLSAVYSNSDGLDALSGTTPSSGQLTLSTSLAEGGTPTWGVTLLLGGATVTYDEGTSGDLADTFASRDVLAPGTNAAVGSLSPASDPQDHFTFDALHPGDTLHLAFEPPSQGISFLSELDESGLVVDQVGAASADTGDHLLTTRVPASGQVHLAVTGTEGTTITWAVTLVPEPGPSAAAAAALATAAALRAGRRRTRSDREPLR
jgi:hypothetical protein